MRFSAPLAPPPPTPSIPQRHLIGTRVANPLEGRVGEIVRFDAIKGTYHLVFNDGYEEDVADAAIDALVIRTTPQITTLEQEEGEVEDDLDPLKLLGSTVHKTITSYDGKEEQVTGSVVSYISDTACYRIVFASGLCEDWFHDVTQQMVDASSSPTNRMKRKLDDASDIRNKKLKEDSFHPQKFPSRSLAYTIVRKVLRGILEQTMIKSLRTEKQWAILTNPDMKPRRALSAFVEANGLQTLQQILLRWMNTTEWHAGAMLVLKIVAVLPSITPEIVLMSDMGRTLKLIARASRTLSHVATVLGDLADWIILTWQREVKSGVPLTTKMAIARQAQLVKQRGDTTFLAPTPTEASQSRAATTQHLMELMKAPVPPVVQEEPEFRLPEYNSLGSVDKRRPLRQIIHIESMVERIRDKMEKEDVGEYEKVGKIEIGKPQVIHYNANAPVDQLLATTRSVLMARRDKEDGEEEEGEKKKIGLPNKRTRPVRSILKQVEEPVLIPVRQMRWD